MPKRYKCSSIDVYYQNEEKRLSIWKVENKMEECDYPIIFYTTSLHHYTDKRKDKN